MKKYFSLILFLLFLFIINTLFIIFYPTYAEQYEGIQYNKKENNKINNIKNIFSSMVSIKALKTEIYLKNYDENTFSFEEDNFMFSTGTGFFIDAFGTILTNYHVIENSDKIVVVTEDNVEYICDIIGYDILTDIAVLKIKTDKKFKFIELDNNIEYNVGDSVFVIGNPYNLGMSMSKGIISGINRRLKNNSGYFYTDLIQTDAAINKGNSGGILFKENGEFIGMISVIFSPNGNNIGIGFAVPVKNIVDIIEKIMNFGYVQRGWIGIKSAEVVNSNLLKTLNLKKNNGVVITDIEKGSPADIYGLKITDVIISYNDKQVNSFDELKQFILNTSISSKVNLVIYRNGSLKNISVLVKEHSLEQENFEYRNYLKNNIVTLFDSKVIFINNLVRKKINLDANVYGLYILEAGEYLKKNGIQSGNIVLSINQNTMDTELNFNKMLQNIKDNIHYMVIINQNGKNNLFTLNN